MNTVSNRADWNGHTFVHDGKWYVCQRCGAASPQVPPELTLKKCDCLLCRPCTGEK